MSDHSIADAKIHPQRILLVDDNRLLLEGLVNLLAAYGIEVVGTAGDGIDAVEQAQKLHPDLILMDVRMPHCDGLEATRRIKAILPEIKIVMLTTSAEDDDLFESIKSGAIGYLIKSISGGAFIEALRGVEQGIPPFSPGLASRLLSEFKRLAEVGEVKNKKNEDAELDEIGRQVVKEDQLTERQTDVLCLVASGLTYKEVGRQLALSERTVRYHMAKIMELLHMEYRSQVISYAGKQGLEAKKAKKI